MYGIDKSVRHEFYLPINYLLTRINSRLISFLFVLIFLIYPADNISAETLNNKLNSPTLTIQAIIEETVNHSGALEHPKLRLRSFKMIDLLKPLRALPVKSHLLSTPQLEVYEPSSAITIERYHEIKNFLESSWQAECLMSKVQYRNKGSSKYLVDTPTCFIQAINPDKTDPSFVVFAIYIYSDNFALSYPKLFLKFNPITQKLERFDSDYLFGIDNEFNNNRDYSRKIDTPAHYKANITTDFEFIEPTYQLINVNGIIYSLHDPIVSKDKKVQVKSPD